MSLIAAAKAEATPGAMAIADAYRELNWAELDALFNRLGNALLTRSTEARIAVFAGNSIETAVAHLGALQVGVSSVPVNYNFTAAEVAYILTDSGTDMLFVGPETADVGLAAAELAGVRTVVGWRTGHREGLIGWDEWLANAVDAPPPDDMPPKMHLNYTSGTTGKPKGAETPAVMLPRAPTVAEMFAILRRQFAELGDRSPTLIVSPLYHTSSSTTIRQIIGGSAVVILPRFDAEAVLAAIDRYRVKSTILVPTHLRRMLALPEEVKRRYDVSSMVSMIHTGAACPHDVKRQMIDWFGPVLVEAYGGTESGTTNRITSEEWLRKPGSVGRTAAPFELIVLSEAGERLGPGETGQIFFRDTSGRGIVYHNDPEKTRRAHIEPGVFTLGDVGHFDEDGYLFITDRMSDMIVSGGVNIYPAEIEQLLLTHPQVADIAVIGVPNEDMGEEVKALVVCRDPADPPSAETLNRFCREQLAGYKCPRSYDFVGDLGRNALGKIEKNKLRRKYWPSERTIGG